MKRNLLFLLMTLVSLMGAQIAVNAQDLTLSDVLKSGCQRGTRSRANENETVRTIILTKEGTILTVQILGFVSNCATEGFDIIPNMSGGSDGEPVSVSLGVEPILPDVVTTCECPFNVSFTLHGLEANSFKFSCWWYDGQVNLTEGEPLTLESITEPVQIDEWYCIIDKVNHTATLINRYGNSEDLIIPWVLSYEGQEYYVTGIGEWPCRNDQVMTSVTLPPNLTSIADYGFYNCSNLKDVYCFADNVPTTGSNVFKGTPIASATLHVPTGLIDKYKATAPWNEFGNIVGEGNVTIDGLNYYLNSSFYTAPLTKGNNWEGELDIPSEISFYGQTYRVTSMDRNAFGDNTKLTKVRIPKSLESILRGYYTTNPYEDIPTGLVSSDHMNPFRGCTALESIEVDEENPSLKSVDGVLFSQDGKGYYYYLTNSYYGTGLYCYPAGARRESYTIPNGVEWIGSGAFEDNQYISTLTIPSSMKMMYYSVFAGCSNLKDIYCNAENVPVAFSFEDFPISSATLHVPAGSVEKYKVTAPWNEFGNIVALSIEINETNFPDENFRNFLLSYYDYPKDGVLTEAEIAIIKIINVYGKGIKSLKGIEYLTAVSDLECVNNQLTELDVSKNTALGYLECSGNPLTSLNVSGCTALGDLICTGTPLTKLDVSGCPKLEYLSCPNNQITTLNVSKNTALTSLKCSGNQLTVLDVSGCTALGDLYCDGNQLTSLDLSKNTKLYALACYNNQLTTLDVSQNTKLQWVAFHQNQIKGAAMDAFLESLPTVDNRTMNVIHNVNEHNVMTKSQVTAAKAKHWEPLYYDGSSWQKYEGSEPIEPVTFTKDQMATIILPTAPDAGKGKYYRLDRSEDGKIIFEQEKQPQAHVPYIIVPSEDFSIDTSTLDLAGLSPDTVSIGGIDFIGSYSREEPVCREGWYIDIIDTTPDCQVEEGKAYTIGALRAYLTVNWDDPINHEGTKGPGEKMEVVLHDNGTNIASPLGETGVGATVYDLRGRRILGNPARGIYLMNGKKTVIK